MKKVKSKKNITPVLPKLSKGGYDEKIPKNKQEARKLGKKLVCVRLLSHTFYNV
ncbi:MAG: hypothetical protein ABI597_08285 [Gammaproteobacteria bacterium]